MCCEPGVNRRIYYINMEAEAQYTEGFKNGWQPVSWEHLEQHKIKGF